MADGNVFFQQTWSKDPILSCPPSYAPIASEQSADIERTSFEDDRRKVFGQFDLYHLKTLAIKFLDSMVIPGIGFEKGFLRPLLNGALKVDPMERLSDISRLPIIGFWNKSPGGHSLQSKLATFTLSGDIRYSIFSKDGGPCIIWDQQRQLVQDFEATSTAQQEAHNKDNGSAAFQTMLCYANAFGTSQDFEKASFFLRKADESGHFVTRILGARIMDGLGLKSNKVLEEYSQCLARGFDSIGNQSKNSGFKIHQGEITTEFAEYCSIRDSLLGENGRSKLDCEDISSISLVRKGNQKEYTLLEVAIQENDSRTIDFLLDLEPDLSKDSNSILVQAARQHDISLIERLMKTGAKLHDRDFPGLLHWLFSFNATNLLEVKKQLQEPSTRIDLAQALNHASTEKITLHPQWPFQVHGTPLATAIAANNAQAVDTLLTLQADPLAPAFAVVDSDPSPTLTSIHLAIRYNNPEILVLLWNAAFGTKTIKPFRPSFSILENFPLGCSLSLMSNAERLAIHGSRYIQNLCETIEKLPVELLTETSPEGRNAITQAIDLEDAVALDLILARFPDLAARKLLQPGNKGMHTYPLHFAVQIGSSRDTNEALHIIEAIMSRDPEALNRPDSSSAKPIHIAATGSSDRILKYLLDRGSDPQQTDEKSQSPLHYSRSAKVVKTLLDLGVDINHRDQLGFTPLHATIIRNDYEASQALVDAGADLTISKNDSGSPLHCAIRSKSFYIVRMLLNAGANVNDTDFHGRSPILVAMSTNRSDMISFLFENDADPFIEDSSGISAFQLALEMPSDTILKKFLSHPSFTNYSQKARLDTLLNAASSGEPEPFKEYLQHILLPSPEVEAPVFTYRDELITALHKAASALRGDIMQVILSSGCEVDARDADGNTPLLIACQSGREKSQNNVYSRTYICEKLVERGADVRARNHKSITPIYAAQLHKDVHLMAIFFEKVLLQEGMDLAERCSQISSVIKDQSLDIDYCEKSKSLIGYEISYVQLIREAVEHGQWDFVMTCVSAPFVRKEELRLVFNSFKWWTAPLDSLDLFRYHCARRNRSIVMKIYQRSEVARFVPGTTLVFGRKDFDREVEDAIQSLQTTLWPWENETSDQGKSPVRVTPLTEQRYVKKSQNLVKAQSRNEISADEPAEITTSNDVVGDAVRNQENSKSEEQ